MRHTFGPRWAYLLADQIAAEVLTEYPSPEVARADEHDLPEDWVGGGVVTIGPVIDLTPECGPNEYAVSKPKSWAVARALRRGSGAKGAPVRAEPVAPPETRWERIRGAVERGEVVKLSPFVAFAPGGAALGVD